MSAKVLASLNTTDARAAAATARTTRRGLLHLSCRLAVTALLGGLSTGQADGHGLYQDNQDSYQRRAAVASGGESTS